jgi:hypothetical protein
MGIKGFLRALLARLHMPRGGLTLQAVMVGVVVATVGGGGAAGVLSAQAGALLTGLSAARPPDQPHFGAPPNSRFGTGADWACPGYQSLCHGYAWP